jgi:hypothetical protein
MYLPAGLIVDRRELPRRLNARSRKGKITSPPLEALFGAGRPFILL